MFPYLLLYLDYIAYIFFIFIFIKTQYIINNIYEYKRCIKFAVYLKVGTKVLTGYTYGDVNSL